MWTNRGNRIEVLEKRRSFSAPLTIGVIADTHIYAHGARVLPGQIFDLFRRAEVGLIIHLGDVNASWVLDELADVAPLMAVAGNNDDDELQDALPQRLQFSVGKHLIGAIHGSGGRSAKDQVKRTFAGNVDLALFGHSHMPYIGTIGRTTLFNPGSATDRRWHQHFGVGIVRVTEQRIDPELILFTDPRHLSNISFQQQSRSLPSERAST